MPRHVKKGDTVMVLSGNERGTTGTILRIITKTDRVVVQGVNIRAKHIKPSQANPQGGIVRREMPIHMSKVNPVVDGKPTRVRFATDKAGVDESAIVLDPGLGFRLEDCGFGPG